MPDGVEILSKISGLPKKEINSIWEDVKVNTKKLEECSGPHDFQPDTFKKPVRDQICSKCGGKIQASNALWYKKGLEHGKI